MGIHTCRSGGNLTDTFFEEFGLSLQLPFMNDGDKLYFPVSQRGPLGWLNWSYIPGNQESQGTDQAYPAPFVSFFTNGTMAKLNATTLKSSLSNGSSGLMYAPGLSGELYFCVFWYSNNVLQPL